MGNNVMITVGGKNRYFSNVNKLGIGLQDGGDSLWIDKNNTEADQIVGKDTDGNEYIVTKDIGGNIVKTKLPTEIRVVTRPNKTSYVDGETIDYAGMVVKAYDANGNVWSDSRHPNGIIPINELTLPETNADYSKASHTGRVTSEFDISPNPFTVGPLRLRNGWPTGGGAYRRSETTYSADGAIKAYSDNSYYYYIIASTSQKTVDWALRVYTISKEQAQVAGIASSADAAASSAGDLLQEFQDTINVSSTYTYQNQTVYYAYGLESQGANAVFDLAPSEWITSGDIAQIAWSMVYGEVEESGAEDIPVQWVYQGGDGELLATSFSIHVDQSFGGATGGAGQAGDTGAGRND